MNTLKAGKDGGSAALADAPALQRHDFTSRRDLYQIFWHFFGNTEHQLAPLHFGPDIIGMDPGMDPKYHKIIKQIGAFPDNRLGMAAHGVDYDLDCFLGKLLGHLVAAGTQ